MKNKTFWASRDLESGNSVGMNDGMKNHIKLWDVEPVFVRPNNVFVGKVYMGMFEVGDFELDLEPGQCVQVEVSISADIGNKDVRYKDQD